MQARSPKAGVCIVRIEAQPDHLLITITTNRTIAQNLYPARSDHILRFADPDDALPFVAAFLHSFGPSANQVD